MKYEVYWNKVRDCPLLVPVFRLGRDFYLVRNKVKQIELHQEDEVFVERDGTVRALKNWIAYSPELLTPGYLEFVEYRQMHPPMKTPAGLVVSVTVP